jgi:hypothetical protein
MTRQWIVGLVAAAALLSPGSAEAATVCDLTPGTLHVDLKASGDDASLRVDATGKIVVSSGGDPITCDGGDATTTTTDTIFVFNVSPAGFNSVGINDVSRFAPGASTDFEGGGDPEIEIIVGLNNAPYSQLTVRGTAGDDTMRLGSDGLNTNAVAGELVPDPDLFATDVGTLLINGVAGADTISAAGGAGTGAAYAGSVRMLGEDGADRLTGGTSRDELYGGAGADTLWTRDGVRDAAGCGGDADTVTADVRDALAGCETIVLPPSPPAGGDPPRDTLAPAFVGRVRVRHRAFRYALSEPATVTIVIRRGHRRVRTLHRAVPAGTSRTRVPRRLRTGRYRARLEAVDAAGNRSKPARVRFRVKRPRSLR